MSEIAILAPDITEIPGGAEFLTLLTKITGKPETIEAVAKAWGACGSHAAIETAGLIVNLEEVNDRWDGDSADAFDLYMNRFPKAGDTFHSTVNTATEALKNVATDLRNAVPQIERLRDETVGSAQKYIRDYLVAHPNTEQADARAAMLADPGFAGTVKAKLDAARGVVKRAEDAIAAAATTLGGLVQAGENAGLGLFAAIPDPGGPDFDPGDKKVVWTRGTPKEDTRGAGGPGAGSGGGSGQGGGPATGTPAPKAEVTEWIKQALTIIKSPEMADVIRQRGVDVADLDPNDPKDVERIWTIIYHESGGNPNSINTWDVNAKNGIPSQGLMQTVPPTFNAHALPGHGKILDPVDNIIAGVLYTYSRYGNLARHPGIASLEQGGGYRPY
ncbi:transglycosylase SLT domain-containing protein [Nonomuraea sp. NPDC049607]|uniref:transglycosylase SLT domain-containing protein n=1 Tax=Nonomuraea sp. NPDC049607 TaxID=3154732 RepID=UPI00343655CC